MSVSAMCSIHFHEKALLGGEEGKEKREMYHHQFHHRGSNKLLPSMPAFPPERDLFLQGGNNYGGSGLVLSTDAKPRLKWTQELHERFIEAVNQLGGADKATPKTAMRLMGIPGLTLYHLKSHLQKYRLGKNLQAQVNFATAKNDCTLGRDRVYGANGSLMSNINSGFQTNKTIQISEALDMQIEVQRQLHEQLEVQTHLQLRIEAQGKYLQSVLEKAQEIIGKQNSGSAGLEAARVQLSELATKVSNEGLINAIPGLQEPSRLHTVQRADCSINSCLTSSEGSQKEQEMYNTTIGLRTYTGPHQQQCTQKTIQVNSFEHNQHARYGNTRELKMISSSILRGSDERDKGFSSSASEGRRRERDEEKPCLEQPSSKRSAFWHENGKKMAEFALPCLAGQLDLNTHDNIDGPPSCKQFDLNGIN